MTLLIPTVPSILVPISDSINPIIGAAIVSVQESGEVAVATESSAESVAVSSGWVSSSILAAASRLWDRYGQPVGGTSTFRFDYASPSARTLLTDGLYHELSQEWEFSGFDIGSVDGEPGYDPPASNREHVPHGGNGRTVGLREFLAAVPGFKISQFHEEHLIGSVDLAQDADDSYPGLYDLSEESILSLGVTDVHPVSRRPSPPLWSLIYGQRGQSGRLIAPITSAARSGGLIHPTKDGLWTGLSQSQWNDIFAFQAAMLAINGILPMMQASVESLTFRTHSDSPESIVGFIQSIFSAMSSSGWAAAFMSFGLREADLVVGHYGSEFSREFSSEFGGGEALVENPFSAIPTYVAPEFRADLTPLANGFDGSSPFASFVVQGVMHSVWRSRTDDSIGLVVANWTSEDRGWSGRFNPWIYWTGSGAFSAEFSAEFPVAETYRIDRLNTDGIDTSIATGIQGSSVMTFSGTEGTISGSSVSLGILPAYSIQAYRFTQE